jgi:hypothetical protein
LSPFMANWLTDVAVAQGFARKANEKSSVRSDGMFDQKHH